MRDLELQEELGRLYRLPCKCIWCPECGGAGEVWEDWEDWAFEPKHLEPCDYCNAGVSETCDRCREIDELESDEEYLSWGLG
jgi:hypothetical protein